MRALQTIKYMAKDRLKSANANTDAPPVWLPTAIGAGIGAGIGGLTGGLLNKKNRLRGALIGTLGGGLLGGGAGLASGYLKKYDGLSKSISRSLLNDRIKRIEFDKEIEDDKLRDARKKFKTLVDSKKPERLPSETHTEQYYDPKVLKYLTPREAADSDKPPLSKMIENYKDYKSLLERTMQREYDTLNRLNSAEGDAFFQQRQEGSTLYDALRSFTGRKDIGRQEDLENQIIDYAKKLDNFYNKQAYPRPGALIGRDVEDYVRQYGPFRYRDMVTSEPAEKVQRYAMNQPLGPGTARVTARDHLDAIADIAANGKDSKQLRWFIKDFNKMKTEEKNIGETYPPSSLSSGLFGDKKVEKQDQLKYSNNLARVGDLHEKWLRHSILRPVDWNGVFMADPRFFSSKEESQNDTKQVVDSYTNQIKAKDELIKHLTSIKNHIDSGAIRQNEDNAVAIENARRRLDDAEAAYTSSLNNIQYQQSLAENENRRLADAISYSPFALAGLTGLATIPLAKKYLFDKPLKKKVVGR